MQILEPAVSCSRGENQVPTYVFKSHSSRERRVSLGSGTGPLSESEGGSMFAPGWLLKSHSVRSRGPYLLMCNF